MKNKFFLFLCLFFILSSFSIFDAFYKKNYVYEDVTGAIKSKTKWFLKKKDDFLFVEKAAQDGLTNLVYSQNLFLKKFKYLSSNNKIDYSLTLNNKKVLVEGIRNGQKIHLEIGILNDWIQDFNFGLRNFLHSTLEEKRFAIINSKDFSSYDMIAFKRGIEKIKINDTTYNTQKVEITLPGIKSKFWRAYIWYELNSYDLLKYQSNEGPGTPTTTISLESSN